MTCADLTPLYSAVMSGDTEAAELLLNKGVNIYSKDDKGMTPIHILMQYRIQIYIDINYFENIWCSKFVRSGKFIEFLLKHASAHMNQTDDKWLLLFHAACTLTNCAIAESLLEKIADVNQPISENISVRPSFTSLHLAACCNSELVKILVAKGANLLACDAKGVTPLDICLKSFSAKEVHSILNCVAAWRNILFSDGKTKLIDYILFLRESFESSDHLQNVGKVARVASSEVPSLWPGYTTLHLAIQTLPEVQERKIYRILHCGANVTDQDNNGTTPVHLAFRQGKMKLLKTLFMYHEKALNPLDNENLSHLHIACAVNNEEMVRKLLTAKANVNVVYNGRPLPTLEPGWTPLGTACFAKHTAVAKVLLDAGARMCETDFTVFKVLNRSYNKSLLELLLVPQLWDNEELQARLEKEMGLTVLHIVCYALDHEKIKCMLDKKVDVNMRVRQDSPIWPGYTPLHALSCASADSGEDEIVALIEQLIKLGCDIHQQDCKGKTALHVAIELCNLDAVSALLTCGADINLVDSAGKSPFYYCKGLVARCKLVHDRMLQKLYAYLSKLQLVGLAVSQQNTRLLIQAPMYLNTRLLTRAQERTLIAEIEDEYFESEDDDDDVVDESSLFDEVEKTKSEKIGRRGLTLYDFVFENDVVKIISLFTQEERARVGTVLESIDSKTYGSLRQLLKLQYRKVVERISLTSPAAMSLNTLLGFPLPDLCVENVFKFLTNVELKCLVSAAIDNDDSGMTVV